MKKRRILIEKIGLDTIVTMYPEGYPSEAETYSYKGNYRVYSLLNVIYVEAISPTLEFTLDELVDSFGATTPEELVDKFAELLFFSEETGNYVDFQDNKIKPIYVELETILGVGETVATYINQQAITVSETEIPLFIVTQEVPISGGAGGSYISEKHYVLNQLGKGNYGLGGIQIQMSDLILTYNNKATADSIIDLPTTQTIDLGVITGTLADALVGLLPEFIVQEQSVGYRLIKSNIGGEDKEFLYTGVGGLNSSLIITDSEFKPFGNNDLIEELNDKTDKGGYLGTAQDIVDLIPFINVKNFGAIGLDIGDDTQAIQDAFNYVSEFGGTVYFPAGKYRTTGNINIPTAVNIVGDGGNYSYDYINSVWTDQGSIIYCSSPTSDLFNSNAAGITLNNVALVNNSTTAPASGIGLNLLNAGFFAMNNITVIGFYDNAQILNSGSSSIMGCHFFNPIRYNIFMANPIVPDAGDDSIVNCHFSSNSQSLVTNLKWESGGGLKITNCKFNPGGGGFSKYHIDIEVKGDTSIFLLSNSSLEGVNGRAIRIRTDGTHYFDYININGNQIKGSSDNPTVIEIDGGVSSMIGNALIYGNTFDRTYNWANEPAIKINGINGYQEDNNQTIGYLKRTEITNVGKAYILDSRNGGTSYGNLNVANNELYRGFRSFSNKGISIGTDLDGILIKTSEKIADGSGVVLKIDGNSASENLPINSILQVSNIGNGNIVGCFMLDKGLSFSSAKVFHLDGNLCFLLVPTNEYCNFIFELQSSGPEILIEDIILSTLPIDAINTKDFVIKKTAFSLDKEDIEITNSSRGLILKSPNGSRFRLSVTDAGIPLFNAL